MPQKPRLSNMSDSKEELSDYRVFLSCMRKRLENYGMIEALEKLERLDDAILAAILDEGPWPTPHSIN